MRRRSLLFRILPLFLFAFFPAYASKSIAILTYQAPGVPHNFTWDPSSIKQGIAGSEESVIYLSEQLAELGYAVTVFGRPPQDSPYSAKDANPRYLDLRAFDTGKEYYDIAVSWRMPALAEELKKCSGKVYLWPHDLRFPLLMSSSQIERFDGVFWLSEYQRKDWMENNPGFAKFTKIFGNGINPKQFGAVSKRKNPYSCIYGSNYGRGLSLLLDIWPKVKERFPKATLDIYYGWEHYGLLNPETETKLRKQILDLQSQGVTEHGRVGHLQLNQAYASASFWTYPCTSPETFCITALRAQMAGAVPVIIEGSALKETVKTGYSCKTPEEYCNTLLRAMEEAEKISLKSREIGRDFVLKEHTWRQVALQWQQEFEQTEE